MIKTIHTVRFHAGMQLYFAALRGGKAKLASADACLAIATADYLIRKAPYYANGHVNLSAQKAQEMIQQSKTNIHAVRFYIGMQLYLAALESGEAELADVDARSAMTAADQFIRSATNHADEQLSIREMQEVIQQSQSSLDLALEDGEVPDDPLDMAAVALHTLAQNAAANDLPKNIGTIVLALDWPNEAPGAEEPEKAMPGWQIVLHPWSGKSVAIKTDIAGRKPRTAPNYQSP